MISDHGSWPGSPVTETQFGRFEIGECALKGVFFCGCPDGEKWLTWLTLAIGSRSPPLDRSCTWIWSWSTSHSDIYRVGDDGLMDWYIDFSFRCLMWTSGAIVGCLIYDLFLATEDVPDCLLHGTTTMPSVLKIFRPTHTTTPLGDPEKHLTTPFEKREELE